jgi:hypothetical protein
MDRPFASQPLTPALSPEYRGEGVLKMHFFAYYFFFSIGGSFTSKSNSFGRGSS